MDKPHANEQDLPGLPPLKMVLVNLPEAQPKPATGASGPKKEKDAVEKLIHRMQETK